MANAITSFDDIRESFKGDYKDRFGIDLEAELRGYDYPEKKVARFCESVLQYCIITLVNEYPNTGNDDLLDDSLFAAMPEFRRKRFYDGVLAQAEYVLNYGERGDAVKFVRETGLVVNLTQYGLSEKARGFFALGAFCNIGRD